MKITTAGVSISCVSTLNISSGNFFHLRQMGFCKMLARGNAGMDTMAAKALGLDYNLNIAQSIRGGGNVMKPVTMTARISI